eukprot:CAMPEP_0176475024 /NCGR_PEP_ID=MMETSP0127-20121128/43369_1 /TAXON_ID=938130 /ORGANISM="Platyophrya macrostoma, Strain WH" /LENGTH=227 /DNA_ID=CAMNT_0017870559 /DNA_START=55 /DNA_END=738 /DNA_ORIENTATION=+
MVTKTDVYFYVPNLIGYLRIALCMTTFYFAYTHPIIAAVSYAVSYILDAADGMAARALNQSSDYGAVLDMVTDRCATAIMICIVGTLFPDYRIFFFAAMFNDITSHWFQMYSTLVSGERHHKKAKSKYALLRFYYGNRIFLFLMVLGSEAFLVSAYVLHWEKTLLPLQILRDINRVIFYVTLGFFALKQFINLVQLLSASEKVIEFDLKEKNGVTEGTAGNSGKKGN